MSGPRSLLGVDWYAWSQVPSRWVGMSGASPPLGKVHTLVLTSIGGNRSGRYSSYLNAYLLNVNNETNQLMSGGELVLIPKARLR